MKWFYDLRIAVRLIWCFVIVALIAAAVGVVGTVNLSTISKADTHLFQGMTVPLTELAAINVSFLQLRMAIRDIALCADTKEDPKKYTATARQLSKEITDALKEYEKTIVTDEGREACRIFSAGINEYSSETDQFVALLDAGKRAEGLAFMRGGFLATAQRMDQSLLKMRDIKIRLARESASANEALAKSATLTMVVIIAVGVVLAVCLGLWIAAGIGKPLKKIAELGERVAVGDLEHTFALDTEDEVGNLAGSFGKIINSQRELAQTATQIASGDLSCHVEIRSGKDALSQGMQQVIQSLEGLISETKTLTQAATEGNLAARGDAQKYSGGYREIIVGINNTLDAVVDPMKEALAVLERVAERDLTAEMQGDYKGDLAKIKNAINQAVRNLDEALSQVAVGAEQVATAASQISEGSQSLSQGASEQASSTEEVSGSLQEVSSMTRQNAANAKEAQGLSESARVSVNKGVESMRRLSEAIDKIKGSSDATAKILKTIDEIAFQTNLLALNAAVEAARAGDAGKGFAVVADEVRNLAMRSAEAAKNTANLIETSVKNAEGGVTLNQEVLKNLEDINVQANKVSEVVGEIASASEQQSTGISQVNAAVDQMNQATQQVAANAEESASAAEELSGQAEEMRGMVATFHLTRGSAIATRSGRKVNRTVRQLMSPALRSGRLENGSNKGNGSKAEARNAIPLEDAADQIPMEF
jgi:methyl-accepting chemotaxis protein